MKQIALFLLLCLSSCRVGPRYQSPNPPAPAEWKATAEQTSVADVNNWWEIFGDETLNDLMNQAIANNPTLHIALERFVEARAVAGIARADLFPQLNLNPNFSETGTLFKLNGIPTTLFPGLKPIIRVHELQYALPVTLSYELDLWGKYRGLYLSARYQAEAQAAAFWSAQLSLTADLASHYYNLRTLDAQIDLLQKTVMLRRESLKLNSSRFTSGLDNAIDVSSAELEVSNTEAQYYDAVRQRQQFENAIATLIGIPASDFCLESNPLDENPPKIPPGLPSTLLIQRPDIAEAERTMASKHAEINVAYAAFFPSITLTGALGYSSPDFKQFLTWKSRLWSYGADAAQFLFDAGKRCSDLEATWARFRQAEWSYQETVLTAFQEVEDALNDLEWEAKQFTSLQNSVKASSKTERLATRRYTQGLVSYFDVIASQRSDLTAQLNLLNVQGLRYQATIALIKALGGSWEESCEKPQL
jgi:outer membrane protein, multidrug efflux system